MGDLRSRRAVQIHFKSIMENKLVNSDVGQINDYLNMIFLQCYRLVCVVAH